MGDDRESEMEMLQAFFQMDVELVISPHDPFSFTLSVPGEDWPAALVLEASLPPGYPAVAPALRVICDAISRQGMGELNCAVQREVDERVASAAPCIVDVAEWLKENAAKFMAAKEELEPPPVKKEVPETERRRNLRKGTGCTMWDEHGDLFEVGDDFALCHCVSKDLDMGAGIAVTFKKQFGGVEELKRQSVDVGGVGVLQKKGRFVYYLVTKNKHGGKPTMETLGASMRAMKQHIVANEVKRLAMPKIGCGLDRLSWGSVQEMLLGIFDDVEIELLVRSL